VNPKTIRYCESIGLLPQPARTSNGYRSYGPDEQGRLLFIRSAQRLGLCLDEIREILALRDRGERPCSYVLQVVAGQPAALDQRISEMVALRAELNELLAEAAPDGDAATVASSSASGPQRRRRRRWATAPARSWSCWPSAPTGDPSPEPGRPATTKVRSNTATTRGGPRGPPRGSSPS
jgi:DNA-binding transcriptional MerR regulator